MLILGFCFLILPKLSPKNYYARLFCSSVIIILALRYIYWRLTQTVWPISMPSVEGSWMWFCFFIEVATLIETGIFYLTIVRRVDRHKQADTYEKILRSLPIKELPKIDVFLPTYNEGIDVLERSIIGCLHLDWPKDKLNVYVLDDGGRSWVKEFCEEKGAHYLTRPEKTHAKAGNINNAFEHTDGQFIVILDADFVPFRNFIYRTVGFFMDPTVSIVQTPQHFFNSDFLQSNLHLHETTLDDQRLFFDVMMPARDAWNVAFWCGSCSLTRRSCMNITGGIPTHSITEDLLTTLVLLRYGYKTRYLNEKLSHGLAPEDLSGLNTQRKRWCRGTIQALRSRDGPLGPGLTFIQRVMFFPFNWLVSPFVRILTLIVPLMYLWFGIASLIVDHYATLLYYQIPMQTLNFFVISWLMPRHFAPFVNSAVNTINAIQVIPTVISSLINPYKSHFAVTPKGKSHKKTKSVHRPTFLFTLFILSATVGGIFLNIHTDYMPVTDDGFFPVAAFWGCVNILNLSLMLLLSIEHPRFRQQERFPIHQPGLVVFDEKTHIGCEIVNLSLTGAQIKIPLDVTGGLSEQTCSLTIDNRFSITCTILRCEKGRFFLEHVNLTPHQRDELIRYIYTGEFDNKVIKGGMWALFKGVLHRAFAHHDHTDIKPKN